MCLLTESLGRKVKMKKILWLDVETTGLDPNRNGLIQLAMLMDIDGEMVDEVQLDFQPFQKDEITINELGFQKEWREFDLGDNTVLPATNITAQTLWGYLIPTTMKINHFLQKHISKFDKNDKAYIGGYNVPFDIAFLSKFYEKCGDKYLGSYINWKQVDVRSMVYMLDFHDHIRLDNYKLATVAEHFGIELDAHNPMSDIKVTRELFGRIEEMGNAHKNRD
jgi:DNA polymerase-3 subunit epsilon